MPYTLIARSGCLLLAGPWTPGRQDPGILYREIYSTLLDLRDRSGWIGQHPQHFSGQTWKMPTGEYFAVGSKTIERQKP